MFASSNDFLAALAAPPVGRNRRISSNEQPNWNDGNIDLIRLAPGEEFAFPVLRGPGYINHIWFTSHAGHAEELNALSLRIYWDDREEPGVEVPVGDFFACGNKPTIVESFPVQVSETGALTCYWRMPFDKSCRMVVRNDNPDRGTGLYWQVDWVELSEPLPAGTGYFHARYRQEYPAVMGRDYTIAEIQGSGRYVGTVMSITMAQDGWFGEGDDFFYIDGEEVPSLQGTGSEDYFNDAWGFRPRTSAWFGQPHWTGWSAGDWGVCYRWHVLDPVCFRESLKVTIEHKGNREPAYDAWYLERPDFISSIAMWYQAEEPRKLIGHLPTWHERRVPWEKAHLVSGFSRIQATGGTAATIQAMGPFGGRPIIFWPNRSKSGSLSVPFEVKQGGRCAIRLRAYKAPDYRVFDILIDGKMVRGSVDFRGKEVDSIDLLLGTHELSAGEHVITFRCASNEDGECYLGLETLDMLVLPPEAVREVKGENERGFIRGGIGSAVYCYRLAYGDVPESLEKLVELGFLDERYLKDENLYPLKSWREGGRLVIESTGPERWTHEWAGADARR